MLLSFINGKKRGTDFNFIYFLQKEYRLSMCRHSFTTNNHLYG
jgi:hypothetical protein